MIFKYRNNYIFLITIDHFIWKTPLHIQDIMFSVGSHFFCKYAVFELKFCKRYSLSNSVRSAHIQTCLFNSRLSLYISKNMGSHNFQFDFNRPSLGCLLPHCQNESACDTMHKKMSFRRYVLFRAIQTRFHIKGFTAQ